MNYTRPRGSDHEGVVRIFVAELWGYLYYLIRLTSGNRTPGSRFYSDLLDILADSVCIHQLVVLKHRSKRYSVFHSPCNLRVERPATAHAHSTSIHRIQKLQLWLLPRARMREAGLSNRFCPSVCLSVVCRLSVCPVKKIEISRFTGLNDS